MSGLTVLIAILIVFSFGSGLSAQGSLRDALTSRTTENDICIGCIVELELMRVYFSWETSADLDMHVFGPGPTGRREVFYGNRVGTPGAVNDEFGAQRCDDLGKWSKTCGIRGERFTVRTGAPRVDPDGADGDRYPYCVALRTYPFPTGVDPWRLVITVDGRTEWTFYGTLQSGGLQPEDLAGLSEICAREIGRLPGRFGAVIELHPLRLPHRMGEAPPPHAGTDIRYERP